MASQQNSTMALPPDENRGTGLIIVGWVETMVALAFVCARMYCRGIILRNVGRDDWTMLVAFVFAVVTTVFVTISAYFGVGRHIVYLEPEQITAASKYLLLRAPFPTFSAAFGKISIAFLLMRIMNRNKAQEIILWFIIISLFVVNLVNSIVTFSSCTPIHLLWDGPKPNPHCWDPHVQQNMSYFQAAYSSFTDFVLAIFPYFIIWKLQLERKVKLLLLGLLSLGIFATAVSIVKTVQIKDLTPLNNKDFTWGACDLAYWALTEDYVIIIAACIPTLKPLFTKKLHPSQVFSSRTKSSGSRQIQYGLGKNYGPRTDTADTSVDRIPLKDEVSVGVVDTKELSV